MIKFVSPRIVIFIGFNDELRETFNNLRGEMGDGLSQRDGIWKVFNRGMVGFLLNGRGWAVRWGRRHNIGVRRTLDGGYFIEQLFAVPGNSALALAPLGQGNRLGIVHPSAVFLRAVLERWRRWQGGEIIRSPWNLLAKLRFLLFVEARPRALVPVFNLGDGYTFDMLVLELELDGRRLGPGSS
jgi:hypothetical protein